MNFLYQQAPSLLVAVERSMTERLLIGVIGSVIGVLLVFVGRSNIANQKAEESGARRLTNRAIGRDNTYTGTSAVMLGWVRVVSGVGFICAALFIAIVSP